MQFSVRLIGRLSQWLSRFVLATRTLEAISSIVTAGFMFQGFFLTLKILRKYSSTFESSVTNVR